MLAESLELNFLPGRRCPRRPCAPGVARMATDNDDDDEWWAGPLGTSSAGSSSASASELKTTIGMTMSNGFGSWALLTTGRHRRVVEAPAAS